MNEHLRWVHAPGAWGRARCWRVWGLAGGLALLLTACGRESTDSLTGYVEGEFVYVASPAAGTLQKLHVARGDTVAAAAPLFQIDPTPQAAGVEAAEGRLAARQARVEDLRKGLRPSEIAALDAQVHEAEATLRFADAELERQRLLLSRGSSATRDQQVAEVAQAQAAQHLARVRAELDTARTGGRADAVAAAEAEVATAAAEVTQARWTLEQQAPRAAHAGLVHDVLFAEGEWVPAGRPVVMLLPPERITVRVFVPEPLLARLPLGADVRIELGGVDRACVGTVVYRSPRAEYAPPVLYSREHRERLVYRLDLRVSAEDAATLSPGQPVDILLPDAP